MKISSNISQIKLNPVNMTAPELLSPFATTPQKKLENELKKIDEQFDLYKTNSYNLQKDVGYTPLNYTPLTDDEIKKYASDSLAEYRLLNLKQINDGASRTAADLASSKSGLETAAGKKQQEIDAHYDAAKQAGSNDALKRGLARSSVIVNKLNALETSKAQAKTDVSQSLFDSIAQIDGKLNELETARLNALDDFDIVYAAKLGAEIQKLTGDRQDRLDQVVQYNNALKAAEAQYGLDYAKTDSSLNKDVFNQNAAIAENDLIAKIQESVYEQKYGVVSSYLNGMTASDAVKDLTDRKEFYIAQLGKNGYDKMLAEQRARK